MNWWRSEQPVIKIKRGLFEKYKREHKLLLTYFVHLIIYVNINVLVYNEVLTAFRDCSEVGPDPWQICGGIVDSETNVKKSLWFP